MVKAMAAREPSKPWSDVRRHDPVDLGEVGQVEGALGHDHRRGPHHLVARPGLDGTRCRSSRASRSAAQSTAAGDQGIDPVRPGNPYRSSPAITRAGEDRQPGVSDHDRPVGCARRAPRPGRSASRGRGSAGIRRRRRAARRGRRRGGGTRHPRPRRPARGRVDQATRAVADRAAEISARPAPGYRAEPVPPDRRRLEGVAEVGVVDH